MRISFSYFMIAMVLLGMSCQRKELDVELSQASCKNLKIFEPTYWVEYDPSCEGEYAEIEIDITFKYEGNKECIYKLIAEATLYREDNAPLQVATYDNVFTRKDQKLLLYGDNLATFTLLFKLRKDFNPVFLNHFLVKFHVENELENMSNVVQVRGNFECSSAHASTFSDIGGVLVDNSLVKISVVNNSRNSNDEVCIALNGRWLYDPYILKTREESFYHSLRAGVNYLVIYSVNTGRNDNTSATITINDGPSFTVRPDFLRGQAIMIEF